MKALAALRDFYGSHGTKVLAFTQGAIATVAGVSDLIPLHQLKYWMGASAFLVFLRGFTNSAQARGP